MGTQDHKRHLDANTGADKSVPLNWEFFVAALQDW